MSGSQSVPPADYDEFAALYSTRNETSLFVAADAETHRRLVQLIRPYVSGVRQ